MADVHKSGRVRSRLIITESVAIKVERRDAWRVKDWVPQVPLVPYAPNGTPGAVNSRRGHGEAHPTCAAL